ncbi:hypothetical protein Pmani_032280 [Petrolisthes manimaculis]|uniref:Uncharacterized protein n=1 Tax=Petrolisthes manimaculis TaxID=1843537 RepID=A0AAE1NS38_9EUCA|nr:hypothetical protein Pmani_032280 [Petrolisthes manimaculis]
MIWYNLLKLLLLFAITWKILYQLLVSGLDNTNYNSQHALDVTHSITLPLHDITPSITLTSPAVSGLFLLVHPGFCYHTLTNVTSHLIHSQVLGLKAALPYLLYINQGCTSTV